ncbi:Putative methyltransferase [Legionella beliardensis]|uniref:Methyltransferase n=1 Tax=Legionella beliardensis TaxID=91822 RepID=A0A378I086_9GAMM|nr:class I SAM-dependent methyltransferase [Legionella beliardensis]STX28403.1 Putative methyltransferase [Legionella beliardensis]
MQNTEWPAEDYAIGSYIQATLADKFLSDLHLNATDHVLDIGCGNGAYTRKILDKVPQGSVLGLDASANMLRLAKEVSLDYPNFSVAKDNVLNMNYANQFDQVVSFWCLQWASHDIRKAFTNIINALKPGGKFFTLFPAGDDAFIKAYCVLSEAEQFAWLRDFKKPVDYNDLDNLPEKLSDMPCKHLSVTLHRDFITLPNLEFFRKFVNGIAFYQGQASDAEIKLINEAMVDWFAEECQKKYQGEYRFNCSVYLVTGEK